ncbi:hypothetical protein HDU93_005980 [Gonapodya sp. JEL0774]|nr:hypothetical protein HDU93_005980 [Gonapodya sp. JEL0774]
MKTETLGRGAFGEIYRALDLKRAAGDDGDTSERELDEQPRPVAIKVEAHVRQEEGMQRRLLGMEMAVLRRMQGSPYACRFHATGKFSVPHPSGAPNLAAPHEYVVMEQLGPSLSKLRRLLGSPSTIPVNHPALNPPGLPPARPDLTSRMPFPPKLVAHLSLHMLRAVESCHVMAGVVHRDVKPGNFCVTMEYYETELAGGKGWIGPQNDALLHSPLTRSPIHGVQPNAAAMNRLSDSALGSSLSLSGISINHLPSRSIIPLKIIDFGLSRPYRDLTTLAHRAPRSRAGFRGTAAYASPACHAGRDLGRVDDLWSWFYCVVEMIAGWVPWKGLDKQACAAHKVWHHERPEMFMCMPEETPKELWLLFDYLSELRFEDEPDYNRLAKWCEDMAKWERPTIYSAVVQSRIDGGWSIESSSGLSNLDLPRGGEVDHAAAGEVGEGGDLARGGGACRTAASALGSVRFGSTGEVEIAGGVRTTTTASAIAECPGGNPRQISRTNIAASFTSLSTAPAPLASSFDAPLEVIRAAATSDSPLTPRVRRRSSVRFSDTVEVVPAPEPNAVYRPLVISQRSAPVTPTRSAVGGSRSKAALSAGMTRDVAKRWSMTGLLDGVDSETVTGEQDFREPVIRGTCSRQKLDSAQLASSIGPPVLPIPGLLPDFPAAPPPSPTVDTASSTNTLAITSSTTLIGCLDTQTGGEPGGSARDQVMPRTNVPPLSKKISTQIPNRSSMTPT